MRETLDLCADLWRFQPDPAGEGAALGYADPGLDVRFWREVRLPSDFEMCHPALASYEGVGWFRRVVAVPAAWRKRRVLLHFEGVNYGAKVWVNGQPVGENADGFLPFDVAVGDALRFGAENVIVVCADSTRRAGDVPGPHRGWRTFGGVLREVALVATARVYLEGVRVTAEPREGGGHLALSARARNADEAAGEVALRVTVLDGDGETLARLSAPPAALAPGASTALDVAGAVPGAEPWSPGSPRLYDLHIELLVEGRVVDRRALRAGFRTIEARAGRLWLNGAPIFLTGFNRHEDSPQRNLCPDLEIARQDFAAMKRAGANFVRLCHYPHHPGELDLCDELGLLVMEEIPLYWWAGEGREGEEGEGTLAAARRQVRRLIARDAHHPSVIFWSVSNETDETVPAVVAGNAELVRLARQLDPTRLAVHVSNRWQASPHFEADDVLCVNAYPSLAQDPPHDPAHFTAFWREALAELHAAYPEKPLLVTEFGGTSLLGVRGNAWGEDVHAEALAREFAGMDAPYVCGATVWCWADHPWPPATFAFCHYLAVSPYGVLTRDRRRKAAYWAARRLFREKQGMPAEPAAAPASPRGPAGIPVTMIRPHMRDIPHVPPPEGFTIRPMRRDEAALWRDIWRDAEPFTSIGEDLFLQEFGDDLPAMQWRTFIVYDERDVGVGVLSAWYDRDFKGADHGRIHWVAVRRSHWGRGLGKAMLSHALRAMAQWHERAYLGTQTERLPAIKLYLDFGFVPDLDPPGARAAWREVAATLEHPALKRALA